MLLIELIKNSLVYWVHYRIIFLQCFQNVSCMLWEWSMLLRASALRTFFGGLKLFLLMRRHFWSVSDNNLPHICNGKAKLSLSCFVGAFWWRRCVFPCCLTWKQEQSTGEEGRDLVGAVIGKGWARLTWRNRNRYTAGLILQTRESNLDIIGVLGLEPTVVYVDFGEVSLYMCVCEYIYLCVYIYIYHIIYTKLIKIN